MICVTIEIRDSALTRWVRIIAPSVERALEVAGSRRPGSRVRLLSPTDSGASPSGRDLSLKEVA